MKRLRSVAKPRRVSPLDDPANWSGITPEDAVRLRSKLLPLSDFLNAGFCGWPNGQGMSLDAWKRRRRSPYGARR